MTEIDVNVFRQAVISMILRDDRLHAARAFIATAGGCMRDLSSEPSCTERATKSPFRYTFSDPCLNCYNGMLAGSAT